MKFLQESKGQLVRILMTRLKSDIHFYERMLKVPGKDISELCKDSKTSEYCAKLREEIGSYKRRIEVAKRYLRNIEESRKK